MDAQAQVGPRREDCAVAGLQMLDSDGDGQCAAVGHGVAAVHCEIEEGHLQLVGVGDGRRQIGMQVEFDSDPGPDGADEQVFHAQNQRAQVDGLRLQGWRRAREAR